MNPWPYQGADRIANVALLDKSGKEQNYGLNGPQTRDLTKADWLEYVVAFNGWNLTVTGSDVPEMCGDVFHRQCVSDAGSPRPARPVSGRRWRIGFPRCWPPSAAQTVHAVFPHTAFTKTHSSGTQSKVLTEPGLPAHTHRTACSQGVVSNPCYASAYNGATGCDAVSSR